ncbi:MAG TPA: outer membrane protein assembly factor BamA [Geminicoccaceae bacterium]|nr:outer membrane protein assembly factor BamA [Geminicoccaceae bacterium]
MGLGWVARLAIGWWVLALLGCVLSPAQAQESSVSGEQSGVIREIRVEGNQRIEAATIRSYMAVAPGEPFDPSRLDQSLKNLFATGLFDDVTIRREGDDVVVAVVENPIINRIAFEGNLRLDDDVLTSEVQLRPRVVYTRSRVQNAVTRILELYRRNGRYGATVEPKVIQLPQNRVDLVFEINEGPLTEIERIVFIGNKAFDDGELRDVIQSKEAAWYRFLSTEDTYDPDRLAFDQELLRRFYLARGYADFNVRSAIAELTPDGKSFVITFTVDEGELYTFGEISIDSRLRDLEPDQLRALLQTEAGDTYNADQIENSILALTEEIGELGYAFVEINPEPTKNEADRTIDLTYVINEGSRVYVERIDIIGNVRTLDEVIRREFRLAEGDAFNTALLRRSRQRIQDLGFFESVDLKTLPGSSPDKTRIEVAVTEQSTGELSFGAGFSTSDGPLGDVRLSERNLLGRGQSLTAAFTISARTQEIDFSFTEPYFLDLDLAAGVDLFRRTTDFQSEGSFDQTTTGGTLRASYPLTERLRHALYTTVREDEINGVSDDASIFIQQEEGSALTALIGHTLTYDVRDTRFLPSDGYLIRLDQSVADFGADTRYLRNELLVSYYYPIFPDWVINLAARGGYIHGLGEEVRLFDRFFLGGATLRGFKFAGVGPRDTSTNDALGGNLFYTGSAEFRFPLGLPDELRIFGRTFVDVGTLYDSDAKGPQVEDSSALRAAAGVGLSWLSPLGPISVDWAQPFLQNSEDETEAFRVNFGTRF